MSAREQAMAKKVTASSNIYTVVLAIAFGVVLVTAAFITFKCYFQYGTIFKMP